MLERAAEGSRMPAALRDPSAAGSEGIRRQTRQTTIYRYVVDTIRALN